MNWLLRDCDNNDTTQGLACRNVSIDDYNDYGGEMTTTESNITTVGPPKTSLTWDDATWILTSAFIIFTMQSGFGLLEAGNVSARNEVNIMVKNVVDVIFGGLTYWMFGFGLSFGEGPGSNAFCGVGYFFVDVESEDMGIIYSTFVFQLSFATTATTIVSGAMAERTRLDSYIIFSLFNTIIYCIPAHWAWSSKGFILQMGGIDFAGSGVVHMVGGVSGLVATIMLKPRIGRFGENAQKPVMCNPANAIVGMFMLWWGWLAFNCGSTFGISSGKWKLAAKTAVTTLLASMSGGIVGTFLSYLTQDKKFDVGYLVNSLLGALVSITASCPLVRPWEAVVIGAVGAFITIGTDVLLDKLQVDDPVSAVAVHGASGAWGLLAVGLFAADDRVENLTNGRNGLFHGGGFYMLGVQTMAVVCESAWSAGSTFLLLYPIQKTLGLRVTAEEEHLGADIVEHNVQKSGSSSQMTFSSQAPNRDANSSQMVAQHLQGLPKTTRDRIQGGWKSQVLTLSSVESLSHETQYSTFSKLQDTVTRIEREIPLPDHLAEVYPV